MADKNLKVLIVDDDRRMARTIYDILKVKGFEAVQAYSGEEAVEKVRSEKPDCVLMDVRMPGMNGIEVLKIIKKLSPDLPVVLISAYATEEQAAEGKRQGAYTVLTKPVDLQIVLSFLNILRKDENILVVDDDPDFCRSLRDVLQSRGYRVETEADSERVLDRMERNYKLTVILGVKLGNTDGLDVLKTIRVKYPTKPVMLAAAYGEDTAASIAKGLQIGAYACLYKPFDTEALIESIKGIRRDKLQAFLGESFPGGGPALS